MWGLSEGEYALMIHIVTTALDDVHVLQSAAEVCAKYGFRYYTIQIENPSSDFVCPINTMF